MTAAAQDLVERPHPTLGELFLGFLSVALSGFGGTLVFARRILVERRRWLTDREFTETLSLCQFLPGPNICNVSIRVGARFRGLGGSIVAFLGLTMVPFLIVIGLGALYDRLGQVEIVKNVLSGLSPAAAGLTVAMGFKMAAAFRRSAVPLVFTALAFVGVAVLGWSLFAVLALLAPPSVVLARWRL
ncbi:MAG: chromate transporter [Proteobacteria bacterium]|nr:chromate transporter [Pseudomonadota bacterium]